MLEHEHQAMAQTLRVLARQRHAQPHVRIRQRDHQAMHVRHLASDPGPGHAEIDLHAARRPLEPHVPLAIRHAAVRLAPPVHVTHRGRILAVVVRLRQQTVVHAPDRVPLLPGQQTIGLQPLVHQMRVRVDLRPVPAIRLRLGRAILHIRVLRDRPAIHVKTPRYLRARHSLPVESPDILHNGHRYRHVPFLPERRPAATGRIKTDWQLGNIQAAAPMPITSPGNDDDTGENHQPTLRKNTAEPVEQTLKQNKLIEGRLKARYAGDPSMRISHECLYQWIYAKPQRALDLRQYLARGRKRRTRKKGRKAKGPRIPMRVPIADRPEAVGSRKGFGHFESDTVVGAAPSRRCMNTQVERRSRRLFARLVDDKSASATARAEYEIFKDIPPAARVDRTWDNGTEASLHMLVDEALGMLTYFADPYSSWQRGSNENRNGRIRRYLPKGTGFGDLAQEDLDAIVGEINDTPMKLLGYKTPNEVWDEEIAKLQSKAASPNTSVALTN